MATIFEDFFTDTNGTALESHTPDTGSGWSSPIGDGYTIQSNEALKDNITVGHTCSGLTDNDYNVFGDTKVDNANDRHGIMARVTDSSNGLWLRIKPSGDSFRMIKDIAGTDSTVAESTVDTIAVTVAYTLRLDVAGTGAGQNFDGYFAGTLRLNPVAPNDAVLDDGEPGIGLLASGNGTTGNTIDNFRVEGAAAGGLSIPIEAYHYNHHIAA